MARKYTVEQLKARQEKLTVASQRQRRELAALKRRVDREEAVRELEALAALGRAVQATLGLTTPADWATWWRAIGRRAAGTQTRHARYRVSHETLSRRRR